MHAQLKYIGRKLIVAGLLATGSGLVLLTYDPAEMPTGLDSAAKFILVCGGLFLGLGVALWLGTRKRSR